MYQHIKAFILMLSIFSSTLIAMDDRIYVHEDELNIAEGTFYIHNGDNVWLETNALHTDASGMFTTAPSVAYVKKWRCPYCSQYWPIGSKCQNSDCPSKY